MSDEWKSYAQALVTSFDHSRFVLILMTIGSVVAFAAYWSSREEGWLASQARAGQTVLHWWDCPPKCPETPEEVESFVRARQLGQQVMGLFHYDSTERRDVSEVQTLYKNTANQAIWLVRVPLFESTISINDLGFFAGIAFAALLFWYTLSLRRIQSGLKFVFEEIKDADPDSFRRCFKFLAIQQLAPVPTAAKDVGNNWRSVFHFFSEIAPVLPLLVIAFVDVHDFQTFKIGQLVGKAAATLSLKFEIATLAFVLFFTVRCGILSYQIAKIWSANAKAALDP